MNAASLRSDRTSLILAPMEGVMDASMRALMGECGGFDFAVSEFIRVSQQPIRAKIIQKRIPELAGSHPKGLPIQVQLLGGDPEVLAVTAEEACLAGARSIDLNFGCPSPTVTRHSGGSALLKAPEKIHRIVAAVRSALPRAIPVSAKIRLGWEHPDEVFPIAKAAADGGADWLVIHARTRAELYRPGVHWEKIGEVRERLGIPVVANGDIFSVSDQRRCLEVTGCRDFMLGRGALADPFLAGRIRGGEEGEITLSEFLPVVLRYIEMLEPRAENSGFIPNRIKQWFGMVRSVRPEFVPKDLVRAVQSSKTTGDLKNLF